MNLVDWQQRFEHWILTHHAQEDAAHDLSHFRRVWATATRLAAGEVEVRARLSKVMLALSAGMARPDASSSNVLEAARSLIKLVVWRGALESQSKPTLPTVTLPFSTAKVMPEARTCRTRGGSAARISSTTGPRAFTAASMSFSLMAAASMRRCSRPSSGRV